MSLRDIRMCVVVYFFMYEYVQSTVDKTKTIDFTRGYLL